MTFSPVDDRSALTSENSFSSKVNRSVAVWKRRKAPNSASSAPTYDCRCSVDFGAEVSVCQQQIKDGQVPREDEVFGVFDVGVLHGQILVGQGSFCE